MATVFDGVPQLSNMDVGPGIAAYVQGRNQVRQDDTAQFEKAKEISGIVSRAAQLADTPQKWQTTIATLQKHFPSADLSSFQDFSARDTMLAQLRDPYKDAALSNDNARLALDRANASQKQPAAPGLVELFDEKTGQPYKATWNPETRTYDRVGGVKGVQDQAPHIVELFDPETGQPYKAQWNAGTQTFDRVGGTKAPNGTSLQVDPATGAVTFQQGAGVKPLTEGQSKDTVFATRAQGALPKVNQYGNALTDWVPQAAGNVPFGWGRAFQPEEYQLAENAGREFLQAILRKDTGAAITKEETEEYGKTYLPGPGDKPPLLKQKEEARARAVAALKAGMPPAAILAAERAVQASGGRPAAPAVPTPIGAAPAAPAVGGGAVDWQTYFGR